MPHSHPCPRCGTQIPVDAPQGICPNCLLRLAADSDDATWTGPDADPAGGRRSGSSFTPLPAAELNRRLAHLEVLELLDQGGMGAVYKARQKRLDRLVAVKVLPPEVEEERAFTERFGQEARALARLSHPNIVAVYDFGHEDGLYYLVMELIEGATLRKVIREGGLEPRQALAVIPKICEALQYAHDQGIVHRDIKPENVFLNRRGEVKIADFGLAKLLGRDAKAPPLTAPRQAMGTPHYMAPEQIERPQEVDHRADIYSLGVVFYELLTGELPLGRFPPPSQKVQIDVRLDQVVLKTLEKEPRLRYQRASELKSEVESVSSQGDSGERYRAYGWHREGGFRPVFHYERGGEYRSPVTVWGWPLVHVALGNDPATGRPRVARGIIALGDVAVGVVAMGGMACGGFCFGGLSLGVMSVGGLALGLVAAVAGVAAGGVAVGGVAVGWHAFGGRTLSLAAQDPTWWDLVGFLTAGLAAAALALAGLRYLWRAGLLRLKSARDRPANGE